MTQTEYLALMHFPDEWAAWEMIPDEWLIGAMASYQPGMEDASEHDRNGAFHWWLRSHPTLEQLAQLWQLSLLDPDQDMAQDVRNHIRQSLNYSEAVELEAT